MITIEVTIVVAHHEIGRDVGKVDAFSRSRS